MSQEILFSLWWILENGFVNLFIYDFFLCVTQIQGKRFLPLWLIANGLMTWAVLSCRMPGAFLLSVLFLVLFAKWILKISLVKLLPPTAIIFTFYTMREGLSAFTLSWLSVSLTSASKGVYVQLLIPILFDLLFFCALRLIQNRYLPLLQRTISSYLYVLLLPCSLAVLVIRYGLHLDRRDFEQYLSAFGMHTRFMVLLLLLGAILAVFTNIEVFCKILDLTGQEQAAALLKSQLEGQKIYLAEAKRRSDQYASFQHDIDNHLLVLSGLLRDGLFQEAKAYTEKLKLGCKWLSPPVSTGNLVLDVLLREKFSYAEALQIEITWDVSLPPQFRIEDMDLCVLFSNILDNAITAAAQKSQGQRFLTLSTRIQANFLLVEAVNSTGIHSIRPGTGLANIRQITEKYQGTMETELQDGQFRISVLLCSLPSVSEKAYAIHEPETSIGVNRLFR